MSSTAAPPPKKVNRIGLEVLNYKGSRTTLCAGCGHNSISERIVECFYELGVEPWRVAKLSGIGCSSKSPAYFLGQSHGFNSVHGRMPSVATGTLLANRTLLALGVTLPVGGTRTVSRTAPARGAPFIATTWKAWP